MYTLQAASVVYVLAAVVREQLLSSYSEAAEVSSLRTWQKSLWGRDNLIPPASYRRLVSGVMLGRQITADDAAQLPYEKMVDMSFVTKARGGGK